MTDASHGVHGPEADPAGEALLVVDAVPGQHFLCLEDFPSAAWTSAAVPDLSLDLEVGVRVDGQRGVGDLGVAHLAVHLAVEPHEHLGGIKGQMKQMY